MAADESPDLLAAFDHVFGPPPATTAWLRLPGDETDGVPFVLRLLREEEEVVVAAHVGKMATQEEKDAALLLEPIVHGLVSIGGRDVPAGLEFRRALLTKKLTRPGLLALVDAYQALDSDELRAMQAVASAKNHPGAAPGPSSAPEAPGPTAPSPSPTSSGRGG